MQRAPPSRCRSLCLRRAEGSLFSLCSPSLLRVYALCATENGTQALNSEKTSAEKMFSLLLRASSMDFYTRATSDEKTAPVSDSVDQAEPGGERVGRPGRSRDLRYDFIFLITARNQHPCDVKASEQRDRISKSEPINPPSCAFLRSRIWTSVLASSGLTRRCDRFDPLR
jgi:hypothetical protein